MPESTICLNLVPSPAKSLDPAWSFFFDQAHTFPRRYFLDPGFIWSPIFRTAMQYGIDRLKGCPQLGPYYAERLNLLDGYCWKFAVWPWQKFVRVNNAYNCENNVKYCGNVPTAKPTSRDAIMMHCLPCWNTKHVSSVAGMYHCSWIYLSFYYIYMGLFLASDMQTKKGATLG